MFLKLKIGDCVKLIFNDHSCLFGVIKNIVYNETGEECYHTKWLLGSLAGSMCMDPIDTYDEDYQLISKDELDKMMVELL